MNILMTYDYGEKVTKEVEALGYNVEIIPEESLHLGTDLSDVEILMCYDPFKRINVASLKKIKYIMLSSTGVDQVPIELAKKTDLIVTNNQGGYSVPIGEWIVMLLLMGFKNSKKLVHNHQNKVWKIQTTALELTHKRIVFIGTGSIAKEAVKRLKGFDITAVGINSSGREVDGFDQIFKMEDAKDALKQADAVVICLPHTDKTIRMIDQKIIELINDDAVFINISRGSVIDEDALLKALEKNKFRFCGLDVFQSEPLASNSPFWQFEQVFITPHNSWISEYRNTRRLDYLMENLKHIKTGQALINVVDIKRGY